MLTSREKVQIVPNSTMQPWFGFFFIIICMDTFLHKWPKSYNKIAMQMLKKRRQHYDEIDTWLWPRFH